MEQQKIRFLTNSIIDVRGKILKKGLAFVIKMQTKLSYSRPHETCIIFLDNGQNLLEDWEQHIVYKSKIFTNSI
jgi:hypothetical protein